MPYKNSLKIATILENYSFYNLNYECSLIKLKTTNWKETIIKKKPDFLLVESLTKNLEWYKELVHINTHNSVLKEITKFCDSNDIPTVFWNTASSQAFDNYINASKLFKYVFTAHSDNMEKYKSLLNHNNIFKLDFAVQPKLFNPHHVNKIKIGDIYCEVDSFDKETSDLLLALSTEYTIHFYSSKNIEDFNINPNLHELIKTNYKGMIQQKNRSNILKKYYLSLNFVSNTNLLIKTYQNIYESLASGISCINTCSEINNITLKECIYFHKNINSTKDYVHKIINNSYYRCRLSLQSQRKIFNNHTYAHRLKSICDSIDLIYPEELNPSVSFIACTNKLNTMKNILDNYNRQMYSNKELIVVLNNNKILIENWLLTTKQYTNIKIYQLDEEKTLGECLNYGIKQSSGSIIAKIDDDDYYGENYIGDAINAFKYTAAGVIGKSIFYTYFNNDKQFALANFNRSKISDNFYTNFVAGATIVIKRNVFNNITFHSAKGSGEDTKFLHTCRKNKIFIYSIDNFNYICHRNTSTQHTWHIDDSKFKKHCTLLYNVNDYCSYTCF